MKETGFPGYYNAQNRKNPDDAKQTGVDDCEHGRRTDPALCAGAGGERTRNCREGPQNAVTCYREVSGISVDSFHHLNGYIWI